jgi:hypothetical protein
MNHCIRFMQSLLLEIETRNQFLLLPIFFARLIRGFWPKFAVRVATYTKPSLRGASVPLAINELGAFKTSWAGPLKLAPDSTCPPTTSRRPRAFRRTFCERPTSSTIIHCPQPTSENPHFRLRLVAGAGFWIIQVRRLRAVQSAGISTSPSPSRNS